MEAYPRTGWNYLVIALMAGGLLLVAAYFLHTGATASAQAATPAAVAAPSPTPRSHQCTSKDVKVSFQGNFVEPETFTLCQDRGSHGHYGVTWKRADPNITSFTIQFTGVTPFVDNHGDDVSTFSMSTSGQSEEKAQTKNLGLAAGEYRYFKYHITVCKDNICEEQDPGGVIVP